MAKPETRKASQPKLKAWDGKDTVKFTPEFAAITQQMVESYLRQTIAAGNEFTLPTRSQFFRECLRQLGTSLQETIQRSLRGSMTQLHRAAVATAVQRWLGGETVFKVDQTFLLPEVDASHREKLTALFGRTTIKHYEWSHQREDGYGYAIRSSCEFTIGTWEATATWRVDDEDYRSGDRMESELALTDYEGDGDFSAIEERVQSGLPREILQAFLYLVAFELVNDDSHARPGEEDFSMDDEEDEDDEDGEDEDEDEDDEDEDDEDEDE